MSDRAVSNVLGYVLLFAVVISSITLVGTVGVEQLIETRDGTVAMNAENSMTGVSSAVDDVHSDNVSRTSRVGLGGGALEAGEPTEITVDIGGETFTETAEPIVYRTGDTQLVYVAGAVFRIESNGEIVVSDPNYLVPDSSDSDMVISLPITSASDSDSVVSGSNAQVSLTREFGTTTVESGDGVTVEFNAPNDRQATLWEAILTDQFDTCSTPGTTVSCDQGSSSDVLVRSTVTEFELST